MIGAVAGCDTVGYCVAEWVDNGRAGTGWLA